MAERWYDVMGLRWWRVTHDWSRNAEDFAVEDNGHITRETLAKTSVTWQYAIATISWNINGFAGVSDEELERHVVHEYCHILMNEMRHDSDGAWFTHPSGPMHEEHAVTALTNAFLWVRDAPPAQP